jgi:hypothetical protein
MGHRLFLTSDLMDILSEKVFEKKPVSEYSQILEPFKVRSVTTGDVWLHQAGRMIQPWLHGKLRNEKGPFRFIGKRHNIDDIKDVYLGTILFSEEKWSKMDPKDKINSFTHFLAGDYKNATDGMDPMIPTTFINSIAFQTNIDLMYVTVLKKTLQKYQINYGTQIERLMEEITSLDRANGIPEFERDSIEQLWGQLMGSPTSFPVLCLANAACFLAAACIYEGRILSWGSVVKKYRPLINGDDISSLTNPDHYQIWKKVCSVAGLEPSIGKNYVTRLFININSTTYVCKENEDRPGKFRIWDIEELFVLNCGLIKGQAKVIEDTRKELNNKNDGKQTKKSRTKEDSLSPLCAQLQESIRVADKDERNAALRTFLSYNEDKLKKSKRSFTLPLWAGGLGLPIEREFTERELQQLSYVVNNNDYFGEPAEKNELSSWVRDLQNSVELNYCDQDCGIYKFLNYKEAGLARPEEIQKVETPPDLSRVFLHQAYSPFKIYNKEKKKVDVHLNPWKPFGRKGSEEVNRKIHERSRKEKRILDNVQEIIKLSYQQPGLMSCFDVVWR